MNLSRYERIYIKNVHCDRKFGLNNKKRERSRGVFTRQFVLIREDRRANRRYPTKSTDTRDATYFPDQFCGKRNASLPSAVPLPPRSEGRGKGGGRLQLLYTQTALFSCYMSAHEEWHTAVFTTTRLEIRNIHRALKICEWRPYAYLRASYTATGTRGCVWWTRNKRFTMRLAREFAHVVEIESDWQFSLHAHRRGIFYYSEMALQIRSLPIRQYAFTS